jgi:hypothetical protein
LGEAAVSIIGSIEVLFLRIKSIDLLVSVVGSMVFVTFDTSWTVSKFVWKDGLDSAVGLVEGVDSAVGILEVIDGLVSTARSIVVLNAILG